MSALINGKLFQEVAIVDPVSGKPGAIPVSVVGDSDNPVPVSGTDLGIAVFQPSDAPVNLTVTTASARTALPLASVVRLGNASDSAISVRFGTGTVIAATTDMDIMPGTAEVFRVPANATHIAAIVASNTATLKITPGDGA